jgi:hypothetical protein
MVEIKEDYRILLISGFDIKGRNTIELNYLSSTYFSMFPHNKIIARDVKTTRDVSNAMNELQKFAITMALIIYVGHGSDSHEDYPYIFPLDKSFDLTKHKKIKNNSNEIIRCKYILDCCNEGDESLSRRERAERKIVDANSVDNFVKSNWKMIYLRRGLSNWMLENSTSMNIWIYKILSEEDTMDLNGTLGCWNTLMRKWYILNEKLQNKRVKLLLESDVKFDYVEDKKIKDTSMPEIPLCPNVFTLPDDELTGVDLFGVPKFTEKL